MSEIKHLQYENGTEEIFTLTVLDSAHAGVYVIEKPDAFDEADCIVDINEEFFNIDNFIIGDTEKITFLQYSNKKGYDIVKKVYEEKGSDGIILFSWKVVNGANEYDLLGEGYQLNLNKYSNKFDKSMMKIETEIKKREVENKFITREDVSVNLFSEKDLDNETAPSLVLEDVYFKEGVRKKGNLYFFSSQQPIVDGIAYFLGYRTSWQFTYTRSDSEEIGDNSNVTSGYLGYFSSLSKYQGVMLSTISGLPDVQIEISNLWIQAARKISDGVRPNFEMNAVIKNGATVVRKISLDDLEDIANDATYTLQELKIVNKVYPIGALGPNESVEVLFEAKDGVEAGFFAPDTTTSIEISSNLTQPLRKTKVIRLNHAIERLVRLYSGTDIPVESSIINTGGYYYNTAISTGMFMRGLPEVYNTNKITTSFKTLFYESASKLLALGFDLQDDKIIIEDISYFFKDVETYDFSAKEFIQDEFVIENDVENSFNQLVFGSKKFSTNKRSDLLNYNTKLEALTPLKSVKTKFDKTIDAIIDEDKISEMILDKSTSTNDNDDDLIMFDVVEVSNYVDEGILSDAVHYDEDGYLWITSFETPFDVLPLSVGGFLQISAGLNTGNWEILEINRAKIKLNKTTGIESGTTETPIKYTVGNIFKNRTDEGFSIVENVKDRRSAMNLRHNPKYQLARWFPFFGSGLTKKYNSEEILITDYKNNGSVVIVPNSADLANELQGETTLNEAETLFRLRENKDAFFSGESIETTLMNVTFHEFFECYTIWRYAALNNRGYITVNTPDGIKKIYPAPGSSAFSFDGKRNELKIKGKVKNGSTAALNPVLEAVEILDDETVVFTWDYNGQIYPSGTVSLQASTDGVAWTTLENVDVSLTTKSVTNSYFKEIMQDTVLYFRIVVNSNYTAKSNILTDSWPYNSIIFTTLSLSENISCGASMMEFEITGSEIVNVKWEFNSFPTGGNARIYDLDTNLDILTFTSPDGAYIDEYNEEQNSTFTIAGAKRFGVEIYSASVVNGTYLTCTPIGEVYLLSASLTVTVETTDESYTETKSVSAYGAKYDRKPTDITPEDPI